MVLPLIYAAEVERLQSEITTEDIKLVEIAHDVANKCSVPVGGSVRPIIDALKQANTAELQETRLLLLWALEQLELCESDANGLSLEEVYQYGMRDHDNRDKFERAVKLSGYSNRDSRVSND